MCLFNSNGRLAVHGHARGSFRIGLAGLQNHVFRLRSIFACGEQSLPPPASHLANTYCKADSRARKPHEFSSMPAHSVYFYLGHGRISHTASLRLWCGWGNIARLLIPGNPDGCTVVLVCLAYAISFRQMAEALEGLTSKGFTMCPNFGTL